MKALERLAGKAAIWHGQIAGIMSLARAQNVDVPDLSVYYRKLFALFEEEGALAFLEDHSDILVHAAGPTLDGANAPPLDVVNWLFNGVQLQFRGLVTAALASKVSDAAKLAAKIPVRLAGVSPGIMYAGFKLEPRRESLPDMFGDESSEQVVSDVRQAVESLTIIPSYLTDVDVSEGIADELTDPAIRDAALMAAYRLAPSGKKGVHTLAFSTPNCDRAPAQLGIRDRVVLRDTVVKRPIMRRTHRGAFIGKLRGVDLDRTRVLLRDVEGVGTLRCALALSEETARQLIGRTVRVIGQYEENRFGKPSMLLAEQIEAVSDILGPV
jgi:hypothetical protein